MGRKKKEMSHEEFMQNLLKDEGWYVPNSYILPEFRKCVEKDRITDDMAIMFRAISRKWANKLKYKCDDDKFDCVMMGVRDCILYWKSFNKDRYPEVDETGHLVYNEDGTVKLVPPKFDDIMPYMKTKDLSKGKFKVEDDEVVIEELEKSKVRVVLLEPDGRVKMKPLNPFGYFSSVCIKGLAKGWDELGYKDCPFKNRVYLSDNIYSI